MSRLVPRLGQAGAARLQALLIHRAVDTAVAAAIGPVSLWCAPDCTHAEFGVWARRGDVELHAQSGEDLGARMRHAFETLMTVGNVLLIGTDCPALTPDDLRACSEALVDADAVVIPAEDGGYVLIGLRRFVTSIFEATHWGSDKVMAQTRIRLRQAGLHWREMETSWDVDRPRDFDRLYTSGMMPEVESLLRHHGVVDDP